MRQDQAPPPCKDMAMVEKWEEKFLKVKKKKSEIYLKKENIFESFNKLELALTASRRKHGSIFQILLKKKVW